MTNPLLTKSNIPAHLHPTINFLFRPKMTPADSLTAVSLFSSSGLGDTGYEQAGFRMTVQSELNKHRASLCAENFPNAKVIEGAVAERQDDVIAAYQDQNLGRLQLLSITPPCQGMSSSNPGRGKLSDPDQRDGRNRLLLDAVPIVHALIPRVVVAENVMQVLKETVSIDSKQQRMVEAFSNKLPQYEFFGDTIQMADQGTAQTRKRAVVVGIHRDEACLNFLGTNSLLPWPRSTHSENQAEGTYPWITLKEWLNALGYCTLDARDKLSATCKDDSLHFVPSYVGDEYTRVADIPPHSGQNAYENPNCRECGRQDVPPQVAHCPYCLSELTNRPYVRESGEFRLIKGFKSSYRRMWPDRPAQTITTASSHVGSDYKIHPWENRVLSVRECSDLQTVPRFYNWQWCFDHGLIYIMRQVIGEALPPWFTYRHGVVLRSLLQGTANTDDFAVAR